MSNGSRLYLPKQPTTTRLVSLSFEWTLSPVTTTEAQVFSLVFLDGASNIVAKISHDIVSSGFALDSKLAEAIVGSAIIALPTARLSTGRMTFGLSLPDVNIATQPTLPSGAWDPGFMESQHPIPWRMTTHPEEQVAVEFTGPTPGGALTATNVVYRFSSF